MPPLPRLRVSVLADLAEQLKFTPRDAARKQLEHAEDLLHAVDAESTYPEDWLVARITGYRPDLREPALIVGEALLRDLGALVERLSVRAAYETTELPGWLTVPDLCARWRVSRRTLERYRALGLQGRRARHPRAPAGDGKQVVMFDPRVVEWFEREHPDRLSVASGFARIDEEMARRMVRRAERYRRVLGWRRGEVARRLAERFGRSFDAVRRLLIRHDDLHAAEAPPIFPEPGPATPRQARLVERASRWRGFGIAPRLIARHIRKSVATTHRIAAEQRALMLRALDLSGASPPAIEAPDAGKRLLAPESVRVGLGLPGARTVPEFIARAMGQGWPEARPERERALAQAFLRRRAAAAIAALPVQSPSAGAIDAIVTDLRWIARLKAELIRGQAMLLLKTVEARVGRPLADLPAAPAARVLSLALEALAGERGGSGPVDRFDPSRGGRLAAPAGIALNKAIAHWTASEGVVWTAAAPAAREAAGPQRATRIAPSGVPTLRDWTRRVAPWQAWTEHDPELPDALERADAPTRELLMRRYGLLIAPPTSVADLAAALRERSEQVLRRERTATRALLRAEARPPTRPSTGKDQP